MMLYRYEPREALELALKAMDVLETDKKRAFELFREAEANFFGGALCIDEPSPFSLRIAGLLRCEFNDYMLSTPELEKALDFALELEKPGRIGCKC